MKNQSQSGNAALLKGLTLFNLVAADRGRTELTRLAADLALPRSTLYRLAGTLQQMGLITRLNRGHYDIGLRLAEVLDGLTLKNTLVQLCRPALRALAQGCGATAHLGILENEMVTYLVKESAGTDHSAAFTRENAQLEAYCTGIGKVLLALLPEGERERYLAAGPFIPMTSRTITDPMILRSELQTVRAETFARDDGEIAEHLYCLAVPLWTQADTLSAAISLSFTRDRRHTGQDETDLARLRRCAAELRTRLGRSTTD
jgi:DNA-binding IclR family transcriptional regulator